LEAELGAVHEQLLEREATMAAFRKEAVTKVALVRELEMAMDSALDTAKSEAVEFEASLSKTQRDAEVKRGLREHIHEQDATIGHLRMQNAHKQVSALEGNTGQATMFWTHQTLATKLSYHLKKRKSHTLSCTGSNE
jgi:hypothetical protein